MSSEVNSEGEDQKGFIAWMARNGVAANVLMVVLIAGGLAMMKKVKYEVFPEIEVDMVLVQVAYPGASPEEVEQGICLSAEEAVRGLDGIKEVRCTANEGVATLAADLLLGQNTDRVLSDVKSAVDRVTSFPENAERPVVSIASTRSKVLSLVLYGDIPEQELFSLSEDVRQSLLQDKEITFVDTAGLRPLEISIEVPQEELRRYGLTLDGVAQRIRAASVELPAGSVKTDSGEILLRTAERRDRGSDFSNVVIVSRADGTEVRLGDIANIRDGFRELDSEALFNGQRASMVNVYSVGDQTPLSVAAAVRGWQERYALPAGVKSIIWNDASDMYAQRIDLLKRNATVGLILVLVILGLFLEPKLAIWVTMGIPISFAGSLLFLPGADVSINMISLFAFIVTLGMVVDDAIVVGEAIYMRRQEGLGFAAAAIAGAKEVARPVTFAILTTCVAFAPMLFIPGVMGKLFRVIPVVVISVLAISLVESLFVLPAHLAHEMPGWMRIILWPVLKVLEIFRVDKVSSALEYFIEHFYQPVLRAALRWRYLTAGICIAIFLSTVGLMTGGRIGSTFMPKIEGDIINARLRMPVGTPIEETRAIGKRITAVSQQMMAEYGDIGRGVFSEIGSATSGGGPGGTRTSQGSHLASIQTFLVQSDQRDTTTSEFVEEWRKRIGEVPGAESLTFAFSITGGGGSPIDVELSHPDSQTLELAASRLAREIGTYNGTRDLDNGVSLGKEQLDIQLTPQGRALGLTEFGLAQQIRASFYGSEAARQQRGRQEVRVFVRRPLEERQSLYNIEQMIVRTPSGGEIPLAQAANIQSGRAYTAIKRVDGRRTINVTSDVAEESANAQEIAQSLTKKELPALVADFPGLTYRFAGERKNQAEAMGALAIGFMLALLVMYGLLAVAFRSYVQPVIVMLAIPFGIVGALWGHAAFGYSFSIMSMMGMVALSGVVVNDSLVLIEAVNAFRRQGLGIWEAVVSGGLRRFRPILLTSLTTFFGLAPMIAEPSVQARFLIPMALSLGFGVLFATAILLLLVPCTYVIVEDVRWAFRALHAFYQDRPTPQMEQIEQPRYVPAE